MKKLVSLLIVVCVIACFCLCLTACDMFGGNNGESKHSHVMEHTSAISPTCTEGGNIEYWRCTDCGNYYSDQNGKNQISLAATALQKKGHSATKIEESAPTCTENGNIAYWYCASCDTCFSSSKLTSVISRKQTVVERLDHKNKTHVPYKPSDCEHEGNVEHWRCVDCGLNFDKDGAKLNSVVIPVSHSVAEWFDIIPAGCTVDGVKAHYTCTLCQRNLDADYNEIADLRIPAAHKLGAWQYEVAPQCKADGTKGHFHCSVCNEDFDRDRQVIDNLTIPMLGHSFGDWVGENPAECKKDGEKAHYYCSTCKKNFDNNEAEIEDIVIPMLGHSFYTWHDMVPENCTEDGVKGYQFCDRCKKNYDIDEFLIDDLAIPAAHKLGEWILEVRPKCAENGAKAHYHCSVCQDNFDAEFVKIDDLTIDMLGHTPGEWIDETPAQCTLEGEKAHYFCSVCKKNLDINEVEIEDIVIPELGHTFGDWHEEIPANCTETGLHAYQYCQVCQKNFDRSEAEIVDLTIPVTHKLGEWIPEIAPLCDVTGRPGFFRCSVCRLCFDRDINQVTDFTIPALGEHNYVNNVCTVCSRKYETVGLQYREYGDYCEVTGIDASVTDSEIVIPAEHDGKPVMAIAHSAFRRNTQIRKVIISDGVSSIGEYAFNDSYIMELYIPASVTYIGERYIMHQTDGEPVRIFAEAPSKPAGWNLEEENYYRGYTYEEYFWNFNKLLTDEQGIRYVIHNDNTATVLDYVGTIPEAVDLDLPGYTVKAIAGWVFWADYGTELPINSLNIPDSVTRIGDVALGGYSGRLVLPESLTDVGFLAFRSYAEDINLIREYGFEYDNAYYLGSKSNPYMLLLDAKERITGCTINENCKIIAGGYGFVNCEELLEITIPDSVTFIGREMFARCYKLTTLTIGSGVEVIKEGAFLGCVKLLELYNKSVLNIETGSEYRGYVGYYALNIYTPDSGSSKLYTDANGYITYTDGADKILVGYIGTETELVLPDNITQIYIYAFYNCNDLSVVSIPDGVTTVGEYAFYGCNNLWSVTIGSGVTSIEEGAFGNCNRLLEVYNRSSSLNIEKGSRDNGGIGYYAIKIHTEEPTSNLFTDGDGYVIYTDGADKILFAYNGTATELVLPSDITQIYNFVFNNFTGFTSVTIPASVTSIGNGAFGDCPELTAVYYNGTIADWCNIEFALNDFGYCSSNPLRYAHNLYINNELVTEIEIPNTVTKIGNQFVGWNGTSITIPESVTSIGEWAFYGCNSLTAVYYSGSIADWCNIEFDSWSSNPLEYAHNLYINNELVTEIEIPNTVTRIGGYQFAGWNGTSIMIPDSVTSIGVYAFEGCISLESITIPNSVTGIGNCAFNGCSNLTTVIYLGTEEQWASVDIHVGNYSTFPEGVAFVFAPAEP